MIYKALYGKEAYDLALKDIRTKSDGYYAMYPRWLNGRRNSAARVCWNWNNKLRGGWRIWIRTTSCNGSHICYEFDHDKETVILVIDSQGIPSYPKVLHGIRPIKVIGYQTQPDIKLNQMNNL